MSIKKFLSDHSPEQKLEKQRYASSSRRSGAAMLDIWIVLFLRIIVMQTLGTLWLNNQIVIFMQGFNEHFGTATIKNTPEHIEYIVSNRIFIYALLFYTIVILVGAFYHSYLNSSAWKATIGKRITKIMIVREEDDSKITFWRGMAHYFLSILPFAFIFYLMSYQIRNNLNFFQTVTASELNVFLGISFLLWVQIHIFTRKKTTAYDMICNTVLINGRTEAKYPWRKNQNSEVAISW